MPNKTKQAYTKGGRQKTCPMPYLYGKEWTAVVSIRNSLNEINATLKDIYELEKQKLELKNSGE